MISCIITRLSKIRQFDFSPRRTIEICHRHIVILKHTSDLVYNYMWFTCISLSCSTYLLTIHVSHKIMHIPINVLCSILYVWGGQNCFLEALQLLADRGCYWATLYPLHKLRLFADILVGNRPFDHLTSVSAIAIVHAIVLVMPQKH
jgi:hypothetical protein